MKHRTIVLTIIALSLIAATSLSVRTSTYTADRYTVSLPAGRWSALTPVVFTSMTQDGTRLSASWFLPSPGTTYVIVSGRCELARMPGVFSVRVVSSMAEWQTTSWDTAIEFWELIPAEPFRVYVYQDRADGQRNPLKCSVTVEAVRR